MNPQCCRQIRVGLPNLVFLSKSIFAIVPIHWSPFVRICGVAPILYPCQIPCYVTCCQIAWNLLLSALKKKLSPRCWSHCRVSGVFAELIAADFLLVRTVACCLLLSSSWVSRPEPAQCWVESFHSCNVWLLSAGLKNILFDIFQTVSRFKVHL